MAQNRTSDHNIPRRGLSVIALFAICGLGIVGISAVLLGASSTAAFAHGGGGHGGGGGFHGGGFPANSLDECADAKSNQWVNNVYLGNVDSWVRRLALWLSVHLTTEKT